MRVQRGEPGAGAAVQRQLGVERRVRPRLPEPVPAAHDGRVAGQEPQQVEPVGAVVQQSLHVDAADVLQLADVARGDARAQRPERGREAAAVVDRQHHAALAGQRGERAGRRGVERERLLGQDSAHAGGAEGKLDELRMGGIRGADADQVRTLGRQQRRGIGVDRGVRVAAGRRPPRARGRCRRPRPARSPCRRRTRPCASPRRGRDARSSPPEPIAPQPITAARSISGRASARRAGSARPAPGAPAAARGSRRARRPDRAGTGRRGSPARAPGRPRCRRSAGAPPPRDAPNGRCAAGSAPGARRCRARRARDPTAPSREPVDLGQHRGREHLHVEPARIRALERVRAVVDAALLEALDHEVDDLGIDQRAVAGRLDDQLGAGRPGRARAPAPARRPRCRGASRPRAARRAPRSGPTPRPRSSRSRSRRSGARAAGARSCARAAACRPPPSAPCPGSRLDVIRASIVQTTRLMRTAPP